MPLDFNTLVRVCWQSSEPNDGIGESDECSESFSEFVVASCDTAELFDPTEEVFHQIAVLVEVFIVSALDQSTRQLPQTIDCWWPCGLDQSPCRAAVPLATLK
jgi:hypothetical protein